MKGTHGSRKGFFLKVAVIVIVIAFLLVPLSSSLANPTGAVPSENPDHSWARNQDRGNEKTTCSSGSDANEKSTAGIIPSTSSLSGTGSVVDPCGIYSSEPAPMGIADYGIGPNKAPYEYNTTSFMGIASIDSIQTDNSSLNSSYFGGPNGMSFQLNLNLAFSNGNSKYVYWVQDVALLDTASNEVQFLDNIWNFSAHSAMMYSSTVSGNGNVPPLSGYYYYCAVSLPGNGIDLSYPADIELKMVSEITRTNKPDVEFMYNDGHGWITYDSVVFQFVSNLEADHGFVVDGSSYNPRDTFYNAELILGGPGGGSQTKDVSSDLQLQLEYWNGHNFQQVANAYNFGSDTAEGIHNAISSETSNSSGTIFANVTDGPGKLGLIYSRDDIGIVNMSTGLPSGTFTVNGNPYSFENGDVNVTLFPGSYEWKLYNMTGVQVDSGTFDLSAGEYIAHSTGPSYNVTFKETGLSPGTKWSVALDRILKYSTGDTITFNVSNGTYPYTISNVSGYSVSPLSGSLTVQGADVNQNVSFTPVKNYTITFLESGLPPRINWYVNITEGSRTVDYSGPIPVSSYSFSLPNGNYSYTIATSDKGYEPYPSSGSFTVDGKNLTIPVTFTEVKYIVTFTESGLPSGTTWSVTLNGITDTCTTSTIVFQEPNGTYSYTVGAISGYASSPGSGTVNVNGANVSQSITFSVKTYSVTFTESGLPPGTSWSVTLNGITDYSTTATIVFEEANGTYAYSIGSIPGYTSSPSSGSVTVNGTNVSRSITFTTVKTYSVTFTESDLPTNTVWFVNLTDGPDSGPITGLSYSFSLTNGSYTYTIATSDHTYMPVAPSGSVSVHGSSPSTIYVKFKEVTYSVTLTESGLPSGTSWIFTFNGNTYNLTNTSYTFQVPNGTYSYSAESHDYKNLSGTVEVSGSNQSIPLNFVLQTYPVIFSESNLPSGTDWYVNITESSNNTVYDSGAITGSSFSFDLANGTYSYTIATSNKTYEPSPSSGSFEVVGSSPPSIDVAFKEVTYPVTFTESGLPSGTSWTLVFDGHTYILTNTSYVFYEPNGTYSYSATSKDYKNLSGSVTINGSSQSVALSFKLQTYSVTFAESGLHSGTDWYVNITESNGTVYDSGPITNSSYSFELSNGTYNYTVAVEDRVFSTTHSSGSLTVNGHPVSESVVFTQVTYLATFIELGLPSGTDWYVNITETNGTSYVSGAIAAGSSYSFSLMNGSYSYAVATSNKMYEPSPSSGSFTVDGSKVSERIAFSPVKYPVTFTESGLPSGTSWSLVFDGHTYILANTSYIFQEPNGTYSYSSTSKDYKNLSGSVTVNGRSQSVALSFVLQTYSVTFTESGLHSGTDWYVNITESNGTVYDSGPITNSSYSFELSNGTYSYTIGNIPGYNISRSSGSLTVSGKNVTQSITFSSVPPVPQLPKKPSPSSNTDLYIIIGAVAAVAVIGAVVAIMMRKRK